MTCVTRYSDVAKRVRIFCRRSLLIPMLCKQIYVILKYNQSGKPTMPGTLNQVGFVGTL